MLKLGRYPHQKIQSSHLKSLSCGYVLHEDVLLERNEKKEVIISGGSRGGPPYFYTKLRPEGRKIFLRPPPLSQGLDDRTPPRPLI